MQKGDVDAIARFWPKDRAEAFLAARKDPEFKEQLEVVKLFIPKRVKVRGGQAERSSSRCTVPWRWTRLVKGRDNRWMTMPEESPMSARLLSCLACSVLLLHPGMTSAAPGDQGKDFSSDVLVYGCTSAGVTAAVQVKKMGRSVIIVCPDRHLGGLSSGGLGWTDTGDKAVIGGLAREFYHRVWKHYQSPDAWKWQKQEEYGNKGQGTPAIDGDQRTMWIFEPHVAERVFEDFVTESGIPVHRGEWLDRERGVTMSAGRVELDRDAQREDLSGQDVHRRDVRRAT